MKKLLPIFITDLLLVGCAASAEQEVSYAGSVIYVTSYYYYLL